MPERFDTLIVGAGYAGSIMAERLAAGCGQSVLVIDRRDHIAGNAYDYVDEHGVVVHAYGPHIFHTNAQRVVEYLSRLHAQAVGARPVGAARVGLRPDTAADEHRRPLLHRLAPGDAGRRLHRDVPADPRPPDHRGEPRHGLLRDPGRARLRPPRLHRPRRPLLRLPLRRASVPEPRVGPSDRADP